MKYGGNIKIPGSSFERAKEKIFEGINIDSIDSYFETVERLNKRKKRKVGKIKLQKKKKSS